MELIILKSRKKTKKTPKPTAKAKDKSGAGGGKDGCEDDPKSDGFELSQRQEGKGKERAK